MNILRKQSIVRFNSPFAIQFSGNEGGPWVPMPNKDYVFGIEKLDGGFVVLLDENPDSLGGIDRSEPILKSRFQIVGVQNVVVASSYHAGFAAQMTDECRRFLESEIDSHENMSAEEASRFRCDLDAAQGSLKQMDNLIFAEIMEMSLEKVVEAKSGVEKEIDRLTESLGGSSDLREIIIWN